PESGTTMDDIRPAAADARHRSPHTAEGARRHPGERYAPLLDEFQSAINVRVERERRLAAELAVREDDRERDLREQLEQAEAAHAGAMATLESGYETERSAALAELNDREAAAREEHLEQL